MVGFSSQQHCYHCYNSCSTVSGFNMPYWITIWATENEFDDTMIANGYVDDWDEVLGFLMSDELFGRPFNVGWVREFVEGRAL